MPRMPYPRSESELAWEREDELGWARARDRELAEAAAEDARERTPEERLESLERRAAALRASWLDGGMATEAAVREAEQAARDLRAAISAEADAAFAAEWTREVTIERRAAWNARVRAGEFGTSTVNALALRRAIDAQGWGPNELKRAVRLHGL